MVLSIYFQCLSFCYLLFSFFLNVIIFGCNYQFIIEAFFALGFILLKDLLPVFYIDNAEVIALAAQLLIVAALFQLSDGLQVVILGALRGLQDVRYPTLICFFAYWVIGFPVSYLLGKENAMGSMGIWFGLLAGLSASSILLYIRFNYLSKKLIERGVIKDLL